MKEIAGLPVREVRGRKCVLVGLDHTAHVAKLAADLHPDTYATYAPRDGSPGACALCPATFTTSCRHSDCAGGYLVDTQWLPMLLMRLPTQNPNS